jgi:hypothetical protein
VESLVVCCSGSNQEESIRLMAEPSNRDIRPPVATAGTDPSDELWVLIAANSFHDGEDGRRTSVFMDAFWARSSEELEALARVRQFDTWEIHQVRSRIPTVAADSDRELCVTNLYTNIRGCYAELKRSILSRLVDAGYRTLGDVVDAGWDGLAPLKIDASYVDGALSCFGLRLKRRAIPSVPDEGEGQAA